MERLFELIIDFALVILVIALGAFLYRAAEPFVKLLVTALGG